MALMHDPKSSSNDPEAGSSFTLEPNSD